MKVNVLNWGLIHLFFVAIAFAIHFYQPNFAYLNWNMFLALLSLNAAQLLLWTKSKLVKILAGLTWFFFYPNSFYMITDLAHMAPWLEQVLNNEQIFVWFMLFVSAVSFGLLVGIKSFHLMVKALKLKTFHWRFLFILVLSLISSLAIHVGRYARLNSWDILLHPLFVLEKMGQSLAIENSGFILGFFFLQSMVLLILDRE